MSAYITGSDIAYDRKNDMLKTETMQKKWRDVFAGTTLDATKWNIIRQDTGTSYSVANGEIQINSGTTINSEFILESTEFFSDPVRALFGLKFSQRITGQQFFIELVSVDPSIAHVSDGQNTASWRFSYDDYTTDAIHAIYEVQTGGMARLASSAQNIVNALTSYSLFELEMNSDEVWFHSKAIDSQNGRSASFVRQTQMPDPTALYKIRIRLKNTATPASNTVFYVNLVNVIDYAEITAEITGSRGIASPGQSMGVQVLNTPSAIARLDSNIPMATIEYSTPQTINATTAGTARDMGSSWQQFSRVRVTMSNTGDICHLIYEQEESGGATFRETHRIPVPGDGQHRTFEFPINLRYYRIRIAVGTSQSALFVASTIVHSDGTFDTDKTITFNMASGVLTANTISVQRALNLGPNHSFNRLRSLVSYDQNATYIVEQSRDGTIWRKTDSVALSPAVAGTAQANIYEALITAQYIRSYVSNSTVDQGASNFEHILSLVRQ